MEKKEFQDLVRAIAFRGVGHYEREFRRYDPKIGRFRATAQRSVSCEG